MPPQRRPRFRRRSTEARPKNRAVALSNALFMRISSRKGKSHAHLVRCPSRGGRVRGVRRRGGAALADPAMRISGPHVHENLAIYFVHGASARRPGPAHADRRRWPRAACRWSRPAGSTSCRSRTPASEEVFIQAGDIVKGGKQDRVLTVSLAAAAEIGPRADRLVLRRAGPLVGARQGGPRQVLERHGGDALARRRCSPWRLRRASRQRPSGAEAGPGRQTEADRPTSSAGESTRRRASSARSGTRSPTQDEALRRPQRRRRRAAVGLEPAALARAREAEGGARRLHHGAARRAGLKDGDVVGYVVAINGKLSSANVYPSNGLFRKMWEKQLAAVVTEAIGEKRGAARRRAQPPAPAAATEFLAAAEKGKPYERDARRRHAPGDARCRQARSTTRRAARRQVGAPQLPGQVARNSRTQEFLDQVEGPWFAVAARQGPSLLALR